MTNLQKYITHSGDCSCYQIIIDNDGISHDCEICDCGALRKEIRNVNVSDEVINCWTKHLLAISRNIPNKHWKNEGSEFQNHLKNK